MNEENKEKFYDKQSDIVSPEHYEPSTSSQRNLEYGEAYLTYKQRVNVISKSGLEGKALDQALAEASKQYAKDIERIKNPYKEYEQAVAEARQQYSDTIERIKKLYEEYEQAVAEARQQYGEAIESMENPYKEYEQSNGKTR